MRDMEDLFDNRVRFETKEQSNERRVIEALRRTPDERFQFFLSLLDEFALFTSPSRKSEKQNFILTKKHD